MGCNFNFDNNSTSSLPLVISNNINRGRKALKLGSIHSAMPLPPFKLPTAESSTSALARPSKNKKNMSGIVSQSSIFDLKGLVSEHQSTFQKEGREAVKGEAGARRGRIGELVSVPVEVCQAG
jgi:hypothetical protein